MAGVEVQRSYRAPAGGQRERHDGVDPGIYRSGREARVPNLAPDQINPHDVGVLDGVEAGALARAVLHEINLEHDCVCGRRGRRLADDDQRDTGGVTRRDRPLGQGGRRFQLCRKPVLRPNQLHDPRHPLIEILRQR